jgi:hypothetical protein
MGLSTTKPTRYEYRVYQKDRKSNGLRGFSRETDRTGPKDTETLTVGSGGKLGEIKDE